MQKKFKELIEFVKKEETEHWAVWLREHWLFLQDLWKLAKKHWFDCFCKAYPKEKANYNPTNKKYQIKTVEDISKLTPEQFEMFVDDLRQYCQTMQWVRVVQDLTWCQVEKDDWFIWVDSWYNSADVTIQIKATNNIW